jgi:putative phosphoribosyl transferase
MFPLRDRVGVFSTRAYAGQLLAQLLPEFYEDPQALVLAIPSGGVPVAHALAEILRIPWDLAVVKKITPRWNSEVGYGAVAFNGTVKLNAALVEAYGLSVDQIKRDLEATQRKVQDRVKKFRGEKPLPDLKNRHVILVDDGLASGFTLLTAVEALRKEGAGAITIAVPTAHRESLSLVLPEVERVVCANLRSGPSFAVADAYENWYDVPDAEVQNLCRG